MPWYSSVSRPPAASTPDGSSARTPWVVLLVALVLTMAAWLLTLRSVDHANLQAFSERVADLNNRIAARLDDHGQTAAAGSGLLTAYPSADLVAWNRFVGELDLERRFPGALAIGHARMVRGPADREWLIASARANGIADFQIWPEGTGEGLINLFLAPSTPTTQRALGFDLLSEPTRRAGLLAARDSGRAAASATVVLKIDETSAPQPAVILFHPVYRPDVPVRTVDDRRAAFTGVVLAPVRIGTLVEGTLGNEADFIAVSIRDGGNVAATSYATPNQPSRPALLSETRIIHVADRLWTVRYDSLPAFEDGLGSGRAEAVLATGLAASLMLFGIVWSLQGTRRRAVDLAERMTASLRRRETELHELFSQAPLGIALVDRGGRVVDCNAALSRIIALPREAIVGFEALGHLGDPQLDGALADALAGASRSLETEWQPTGAGRRSHYRIHVQPVYDEGDLLFVLLFVEDVGERKRAEQHVQYMAHYDALTGLPNRILLFDRIGEALAGALRDGRRVAVVFIDLDRFKVINDSLGHSFGDAVLRDVARRLGACAAAGDTVGRLGGDEFLIVAPDRDGPDDAAAVAEAVHQALKAPFLIDGHSFTVSPSIGIALFPDDAQDAEGLVRCADIAMYTAKDAGRNGYRFVTSEMGERSRERLSLEADLRRALVEGELFMVYQPQIRVADGALVGVEALLRWRRADGVVPPGQFLPVAEETGLIVPIGDWVLEEVCQQIRAWKDRFGLAVSVAVNLSGAQFRDADLPARVFAALDGAGLEGHELEVEVTESVLIANIDAAADALIALKARGVLVALDDFGTGYSSFGYLHRFPIDKLKIDRSFIQALGGQGNHSSIPRAIIGLGGNLGLMVVAEGVETEVQRDFLHDMRCHAAQGYLFGRPVEAEGLEPLLADRQVPV